MIRSLRDRRPIARAYPALRIDDAAPQRVTAAGRHGARGALLGELDAVLGRELEQRLALLALARGAREQPAEQQDGDDRALDEHDRPRRALVVGGGDVPVTLARRVARVEHAA